MRWLRWRIFVEALQSRQSLDCLSPTFLCLVLQVSTEEVDAAKEVEPLDSYVLVEKADVMAAMADFVAAYLMQLPEAQHLKPQELQKALGGAIAVRFASVHAAFLGAGLSNWQNLCRRGCCMQLRICDGMAAACSCKSVTAWLLHAAANRSVSSPPFQSLWA